MVLTKIADQRYYRCWVNWLSLKVLKCDFLSTQITFRESVSSLDLHIEVFPVLSLLSVCSFFPLINLPRCFLLSCYLVSLLALYIASIFIEFGYSNSSKTCFSLWILENSSESRDGWRKYHWLNVLSQKLYSVICMCFSVLSITWRPTGFCAHTEPEQLGEIWMCQNIWSVLQVLLK